ncbi:MAG TPA: hypothetical protein VIM56_14265 [Rhizomicrobium sp.]
MKRLAAGLAFATIFGGAAFADAPLSHYAITPLTKADVDLYLSVMRPASAYVANLKGEDKAAVDYVHSNHGNPKMPEAPKVPDFGGQPPTPAQMAAMQKAMDDYNKKIQMPQKYMGRAATLASYDEEVARQHHVEKQYDAVKDSIESAMAAITGEGGSCGGDDCGPTEHPTAAQLALWKKEEDVAKANVAFLRPYAPEIMRLKKPLHDVMFAH